MTDMNQTHLTRTQRQYAAIVDLVTNQSVLEGGFPGAARLLTETAAEVLEVERVGVWLLNEGRTTLRCIDLFERTPAEHSEAGSLDARSCPRYFDALAAGRAVDAHDARTDPRTNEFADAYLVPHGITSMLDAPIRVSGDVVGVVCHEHVGPARRWTNDEVSFAAQIADQAAQSLANERRKRAEESLRESEAKYRQLVEQSLEGLVIAQGLPPRLVFANQAMADMLGYSVEDLLEMPPQQIAEMVHPEDREFFFQNYEDRLRGDPPAARYEFRGVRKDGAVRWLSISSHRIVYQGQPASQALFMDVTDRKNAQQQLRQRDAEMAHMNRLHTIGEMAGGLAHELNQPLYAINNYVCGIRRRLEQMGVASEFNQVSAAIDHVSSEVMRASGIIDRLREFVRGREPRRSNVDVEQLLHQSLDLVGPLARDKGVTLKFESHDSLPVIEADRVQVGQVVVNLVANAIEATSELSADRRIVVLGGRLSDTGVVEITVRDCGRGVAKELEGKLFEAFASTKENGLGVGLAISRTIIRSHGGKIWFSPNEPHGAIFHFTLPQSGTALK